MMKVVAASAVLAGVASAQGITFNSPSALPQCQPVQLTWTGGVAPFIITAIPGGQISAAPLTTISSDATGNSLTWTVNVAAGTDVTLAIRDSTGAQQFTGEVTVQDTGSSSCLGSSASVVGATGTSAASGASSIASAASSAGSAASSAASSVRSAASSAGSSVSSAVSSAVSSVRSAATTGGASSSSSGSAPAGTSASGDKSGANAVSVGLTGLALTIGGLLLRVIA